jgi:hypothetical protein
MWKNELRFSPSGTEMSSMVREAEVGDKFHHFETVWHFKGNERMSVGLKGRLCL